MLAAAVGGVGRAYVGVATTECIANKQLLEAKLSYRHISIQHNAAKQEMQF